MGRGRREDTVTQSFFLKTHHVLIWNLKWVIAFSRHTFLNLERHLGCIVPLILFCSLGTFQTLLASGHARWQLSQGSHARPSTDGTQSSTTSTNMRQSQIFHWFSLQSAGTVSLWPYSIFCNSLSPALFFSTSPCLYTQWLICTCLVPLFHWLKCIVLLSASMAIKTEPQLHRQYSINKVSSNHDRGWGQERSCLVMPFPCFKSLQFCLK